MKAGGAAAATMAENKLDEQLSKVGIKAGQMNFTFNADSTFTSTVGKKTLKGTYSYDASAKQVDLKFLKLLNLSLIHILEFKYIDEIPLYKGGPIATDTLFYLHTLADIPGAISICTGLYLNGDFEEIKRYILQGNKISEHIRFFLGYSGWESEQLSNEIRENTWLVSEEKTSYLMRCV